MVYKVILMDAGGNWIKCHEEDTIRSAKNRAKNYLSDDFAVACGTTHESLGTHKAVILDRDGDVIFDIFWRPVKLKTETDTKSMEKRVLAMARKKLRVRKLSAFFEHGQWWITNLGTGAQYSVVDAEGPGTIDGFDLEQVTEGDEYQYRRL